MTFYLSLFCIIHIRHTLVFQEYGLVFVSNDTVSGEEGKSGPSQGGTAALVTPQAAEVLKRGEGNLGRSPGQGQGHIRYLRLTNFS